VTSVFFSITARGLCKKASVNVNKLFWFAFYLNTKSDFSNYELSKFLFSLFTRQHVLNVGSGVRNLAQVILADQNVQHGRSAKGGKVGSQVNSLDSEMKQSKEHGNS
jgi:hypothetical protein